MFSRAISPSLRFLGASSLAASLVASCGDDGAGSGGSGGGASSTGATTGAPSSSSATTGGGGGEAPLTPTPPADPSDPWELLSQWNLFLDGPGQVPATAVVHYDVNSPLFSDEALKLRFLHVPEGATIGYEDEGVWGFPDGSILVKTFAYPEDARDPDGALQLVETRLLWRTGGAWRTLTYVWNEAQTDAERTSAGASLPITWVDAEGEDRELDYAVPNTNQCKECHSLNEQLESLGGVTLQLDRPLPGGDGNQIDHFAELGWFDTTPTPAPERSRLVDPFGEEDVILRARSYLHANCSSCHVTGGTASQSSLLLHFADSDPEVSPDNLGICKIPTSAGGATCGLTYDIVPGDPDASVLICRVASADTEVRMPPLARQLVHDEGVQLLRQMIEALPPADCAGEGGGGAGGGGAGGGGAGGSGGAGGAGG